MLIYNTTFHVTGERERSHFLNFMYEVYLPQSKACEYLTNHRFVSLITSLGDDVSGFALMADVRNVADLKRWKQEKEERLLTLLSQQFGEKVLTFSTVMKVMDI